MRNKLFVILFIFTIGFFTLAVLLTEENKIQEHPCDKVLVPEDDPNGECIELYSQKIIDICEKEDPEIDSLICTIEITFKIMENCIEMENTFNISYDVCFYKSIKNFIYEAEKLE